MKYLLSPLMPMPVYLALFTDEKSYRKWLKREGIRAADPFVSADANGCCHYFENDETHATLVAVCLDMKKLCAMDAIRQAATIIHESVHVYQECLRFLGEKNPGDEFAAYSIQNIAEQLMRAYAEQTLG